MSELHVLSILMFQPQPSVQVRRPVPSVDCTYEAPDTCTGTQPLQCCERLGSGAVQTVSLHMLVYSLTALLVCVLNVLFL